jgi:nicotinate-nucleotide adenylyltransferase
LYVPAAEAPLKGHGPSASDEDRLAMLRAAIMLVERASVTDIEMQRGGVSYTVETLRELRRALPGVRAMRLLIGADQAAQFHRWRSAREIIGLAEPAVMLRGDAAGETKEEVLGTIAAHWDADELEAWRGRFVDVPALDVSSTLVREELAREPRDRARLAGLLPAGVMERIEERGLYR